MSNNVTDRVKFKATVMWAFLKKQKEGNEKYTVCFANLTDAAVDALEAIGIEVKRKAERPELGYFINCSSKLPIRALDQFENPLPDDVLVGNGSIATVIVTPYAWSRPGKKGVSPTIRKFVVTDLKVYNPDFDDADAPL